MIDTLTPTLLQLFVISSISLFLADFEPFQKTLNIFKTKNIIYQVIRKILGCSKCLTFWTTFIYLSIELFPISEIFIYSCVGVVITKFLYKITYTTYF